MPQPQYAVALFQALLRYVTVTRSVFSLILVYDGFILIICKSIKPSLPKNIHFAIVEIAVKKRVGEYENNRRIRQELEPGNCSPPRSGCLDNRLSSERGG